MTKKIKISVLIGLLMLFISIIPQQRAYAASPMKTTETKTLIGNYEYPWDGWEYSYPSAVKYVHSSNPNVVNISISEKNSKWVYVKPKDATPVAGTATLTVKYGNKVKKTKFIVKKYSNPFKKLSICGTDIKNVFKDGHADGEWCIETKVKNQTGKISIKLKSGFKLKKILINGKKVSNNKTVTLQYDPDDLKTGWRLIELHIVLLNQKTKEVGDYITRIYYPQTTCTTTTKNTSSTSSTTKTSTPLQPKLSSGTCGGAASSLSVSNVPSGCKVAWSSSNTSVVSVNNGTLSACGSGTAKVTATVTASDGRVSTVSKSINVKAVKSYGSWSDWTIDSMSSSSTKQVQSSKVYRYYYFYCPVCGGREPYQGMSDCHQYSLSLSDGHVGWFTTPYSQCASAVYSYSSAKRYTRSLGDGLLWNFSSSNINDTAIGTKDCGVGALVIAQGYRSRSITTSYVINSIT